MSLITITASGLKQFRKIIKNSKCEAIHLSLRSGGCNGFEYDLRPTKKKLGENDELHSENGVNIHISKSSVMHLIGTEIDWKNNVMGESFTFNNPRAAASCGCGTSFSPKSSEEKKDIIVQRMKERDRW